VVGADRCCYFCVSCRGYYWGALNKGTVSNMTQGKRLLNNEDSLAIFGTGQMADLASYYFKQENINISFYLHDNYDLKESKFLDKPVLHLQEFISEKNILSNKIFVAVSYHEQNCIREKYFQMFLQNGYDLISYVSKDAFLASDVIIGKNCLVLEGAVVQKTTQIRDNTFIWTGAQIGHRSTLGENVFIGSGAVLMGCNAIGRNSHVSANATIYDHVEIEPHQTISPGKILGPTLIQN